MKTGIIVDVDELKKYLYRSFEMNFFREWEDLPEWRQEYWTRAAQEMSQKLISLKIVEIYTMGG